MAWRDEIDSGLPSPREDEPPGLRRAIEDELADHLACALEREVGRLSEPTSAPAEQAARRAVLARFGNPKLVAYQLWWDAMKEKIMKDRLMIAASALLMLTCFAALGALWFTLKESRATNAALLAQIKELMARPAPAAAPPIAGNMAHLQVKASMPNGKPAPGLNLRLRGYPFVENKEETLEVKSDLAGLANIGPIRAGQYDLSYQNPKYSLVQAVLLYGGQSQELAITCPQDLLSTPTAVSFRVDWPQELAAAAPKDSPLSVGGTLIGDPSRLNLESTPWFCPAFRFLRDRDGKIASGADFIISDQKPHAVIFSGFESSLPIIAGKYRLCDLSVCSGKSDFGRQAEIVAHMKYPEGQGPVYSIPAAKNYEMTVPLPEEIQKILREAFIEQTAILRVKEWYRFRDANFTPEFYGTTTERPETLVKIKAVQGMPEAKEMNLKQGQSGNVGNIEVTVLEILNEGGIRCRCRFRFVPHPVADSTINQTRTTTQTQTTGGRP